MKMALFTPFWLSKGVLLSSEAVGQIPKSNRPFRFIKDQRALRQKYATIDPICQYCGKENFSKCNTTVILLYTSKKSKKIFSFKSLKVTY